MALNFHTVRDALIVLACCCVGLGAYAVEAPPKSAKTVAKKPLSQRVAAKVLEQPPQALVVIESLSAEQKALAQRVVAGNFPCELGVSVDVQPLAAHEGHFRLVLGKQNFVMVPVSTESGAVRLEDASSGSVWLQLANKSMLLNHKQGKRLADACMSADQTRVAEAMARDPASHLLAVQKPAAGVAVAADEQKR